jgi:biotin-dependent carboxylase-like uncharacterized protein
VSEIEVLSAGPLTTVQDRGRPGWAHIGVPPSGAVDGDAFDRGNTIVGNGTDAAALEATLAGPRLRFTGAALVAVTGATADVFVSGEAAEMNVGLSLRAGEVLEVGGCRRGVRTYVAVRGGVDVPPTLGSRSTDLLSGLGPRPLRDGDVLGVGPEPQSPPQGGAHAEPSWEQPVLRVTPGPRDDWFAAGALELLVAQAWRVGSASNRVGVRLEGPRLERVDERELLSEGLVTGALQVPPSGQPILLLNDHPTTGGYPVIAVVRDSDLARAGQLGPGATVRFALA